MRCSTEALQQTCVTHSTLISQSRIRMPGLCSCITYIASTHHLDAFLILPRSDLFYSFIHLISNRLCICLATPGTSCRCIQSSNDCLSASQACLIFFPPRICIEPPCAPSPQVRGNSCTVEDMWERTCYIFDEIWTASSTCLSCPLDI